MNQLLKMQNNSIEAPEQKTLHDNNKLSEIEHFIELSSDLLLVYDFDWNIITINDASTTLIGYRPEEVIGKSCVAFLHPEDREFVKNFIESNVEKKVNNVSRILCKNGSYKWFEWNTIPLEKENRIFAVGKDITEKVQMGRQLRQSEERFMKSFRYSPTMVSIVAIKDGHYGEFIDVNVKWIEVMGYQPEEVIGRFPSDLNLHSNPKDLEKLSSKLRKTGRLTNEKVLMRSKDGKEIITLCSAEPIELNGVSCLLVNLVDITEYDHLEKELLRLERLNLIGKLAAGLGHEIRNPMQTVRGFLQIIGTRCEREKEHFDLMISELDRVNHIISEFLSLSKRKPENLKGFNLDSVIQSFFPLIQAKAFLEEKDACLDLQTSANIVGDEKEIKQLMINLAQNGIEAMEPGKKLFIKTFEEGSYVVLAIIDQGKGIEPEIYRNLGTPFVTDKDNGTGLGLAVCYSIAKRHNAIIEVDTSAGGTTFFVKFPVESE
ncbi:PAS domain-containing sensor histidine kinase [Heliorestis convoluta]|uniref:histidine kinase n=1 Tax=Heliorestis convoluta TaxID=356322 RepID=A0A5Q2N4W1_9FIRM|nr:PAS domain-containing sensor histidine kinase [Heliorestis convoluta]QGG48973.1 sensory histidine kinase [Heliorestis convoluta]